jgi:membrane-anchored glycerophosphoryl diester phosphodiesterase (GDPDase)
MHLATLRQGDDRKGMIMIDIGRVFSTAWAMLRQRFWPLVGMWAVFFAIQMGSAIVLGIVVAVMGVAGAGMGSGLEDPSALAGMGIGLIVMMVLFYGAYLVLILAQQAAMVTLASPLEEPSFGAAMSRGFKSALPFFGIAVVMLLAYFLLAALLAGVIGAAGLGSPEAAEVLGGVLVVLFLPVMLYLAARFSVLVPVVAVDQVFNPIAAIRRSWDVTRGKVLRILMTMFFFFLLSIAIIGVPFLLIFGASFGLDSGAEPSAGAVGAVLGGFLLFIPLMIVYTIFASAYTAALHSEVTGGGAEAFEEVFA